MLWGEFKKYLEPAGGAVKSSDVLQKCFTMPHSLSCICIKMIAKVATKRPLGFDEAKEKLEYWLTRPVEERIAHVEELRRDFWGEDYETRLRLSRTADAVKRARR